MSIQLKSRQVWRTLLSLWCLAAAVSGQNGNYDYNDQYPDYNDYAGDQGYDDNLYQNYAAHQQDKAAGGGGYVNISL
jgi:hypothetical protein